MKQDHTKRFERAVSADQLDKMHELTIAELNAAVGGKGAKASSGKLFETCCKGTHIPEVTIELW
jgi:type VI protein secretion system component Hcp